VKVRVIDEKCQGHGRCYMLAPDLFESDDIGNAVVCGDGTVSPDQEADARLAADNCPEFAIEIIEG
jgi:ferredoxin